LADEKVRQAKSSFKRSHTFTKDGLSRLTPKGRNRLMLSSRSALARDDDEIARADVVRPADDHVAIDALDLVQRPIPIESDDSAERR
jgi:hypothetical protein